MVHCLVGLSDILFVNDYEAGKELKSVIKWK
jgi:hypothetical protein